VTDDERSEVADELAIRNLLAALSWHADTTTMEDLDSYVACFTEDAMWEMLGDVRRGHAEILAGAQERRRNGTNGPGTDVRHSLSMTVVEFPEPGRAVARSYIQAYRTASTAPSLFMMGEYHDAFRRTPEGWRLVHRKVDFRAP